VSPGRIPNPVSNARDVLNIVRELSLDDLHDRATNPLRLAVIARTTAEARNAAERILGPEARRHVVALSDAEPWPDRPDVVLVERWARPRRDQRGEVVLEFSYDEPVERVRQVLYRAGDDFELALGRQFPELRSSAALHVVNTTSRVNAQFALVSNVPALVPVVGGFIAAGADTIVLTKNQLMMIFKLAAIHGRDIDNRWQIYREMVPVVGAGLFWRTVARELAVMIPFAAGTVPKVAIAFAGTYAAGMAAHAYYVEGRKPGTAQMQRFYQQGLRELREIPALVRALPTRVRNGRDDPAGMTIDVDYKADAATGIP
jgi:uncharacterized protein (DUF697 family)